VKTLRKVDVLLSLLLSKEQQRLIPYTQRFQLAKDKPPQEDEVLDDRDLIKLLPPGHPLNSQLLRELVPETVKDVNTGPPKAVEDT
jgi:hypothetical protein